MRMWDESELSNRPANSLNPALVPLGLRNITSDSYYFLLRPPDLTQALGLTNQTRSSSMVRKIAYVISFLKGRWSRKDVNLEAVAFAQDSKPSNKWRRSR